MLNDQEQIVAIKSIQEFFLPVKTWVTYLNYLDTPEFYFVIIAIVWFVTQQKYGFRLFFLTIFSNYLNTIIKQFYEMPRPFMLDPSLMWVKVEGFGFPSGGAQTSLILALFAYELIKKYRLAFLVFLFPLIVSFSRIVIGVHFFVDIIGGWLVSLGLYACYRSFYLPNEAIFFPIDTRKRFKKVLTLFSALPFFFISGVTWKIWAFVLGIIAGDYFFCIKNIDRLKFSKKIRMSLTILTLFVLTLLGFKTILPSQLLHIQMIKNFGLGFSLFFIASLVNVIFELRWDQKKR